VGNIAVRRRLSLRYVGSFTFRFVEAKELKPESHLVEFAEGPSYFQELETVTFVETATISSLDISTETDVAIASIICDSLSMDATISAPTGECTHIHVEEIIQSNSTQIEASTISYSVSGSAFTTLTFASATVQPTGSGTSSGAAFRLLPSRTFLGIMMGALIVWL
jgi:hypothetical protein